MKPRWTFDHVVAVLELVCAVVVVVWMVALGVAASGTPGRTPLDRAFPFLVGLGAGALLVRWSVRSWRAGNRAATAATERAWAQDSPDPPVRVPEPSFDPDARTPEPLSPDGEREVARVVAVLGAAGVFAPHVPAPEDLRTPVADHGEPVTAWSVLSALHEARYYVPEFDATAYHANLAFHDSQVEQFTDFVREQVDDLVRLAGGGLDDVVVAVELTHRANSARVPTTIRLTVRGDDQVRTYDGAWKYLSTVVHVTLARILRDRATGRRLAWLWSDQGVWLSGLPDGAVEELNIALGPAAGEGWEWVDEQEPVAAGEVYPP